MRKTKIICTLGPASQSEEILSGLILNGMNASRHNFSHGDHEEHRERMNLVKKLREKYNKPIAIILDTKGPEIRTGKFNNGKVELKQGSKFTVYCNENILGDETKCSISYDKLYEDVKPGNVILIADGLVGLDIVSIDGSKINTIVKNSGVLGDQKNVNIPGISVKLPAITQKDVDDLVFGIEEGIDIIAASFIRKAADVLEIRKVLEDYNGTDILIFSKIENQEGIDNIDEIIKFSDGIMVARGDLGVEIPTEEVPLVQKMIIKKCNEAGKAVITATQMLDSMIRYPRPTRAEASDVANAIFDGTDAIMLSGETASGSYPVETVSTMARIAERTEKALNYLDSLKYKRKNHVPNVPNAISLATCNTAMDLNAAAIITVTQTGHTARMVSKYRPECPIIAVTPYEKVARKLALNWGVFPIISSETNSTDELIENSVEIALQTGYIEKGDLVIIAAGIPSNYAGTTNMMKVHIAGDILIRGKGLGDVMGYGTANVVHSFEEATNNITTGDILVLKDITEDYIALFDKLAGIITENKIVPSSVAIECLARGIPLIFNAKASVDTLKTGSFITMDIRRGVVYSGRVNIK